MYIVYIRYSQYSPKGKVEYIMYIHLKEFSSYKGKEEEWRTFRGRLWEED